MAAPGSAVRAPGAAPWSDAGAALPPGATPWPDAGAALPPGATPWPDAGAALPPGASAPAPGPPPGGLRRSGSRRRRTRDGHRPRRGRWDGRWGRRSAGRRRDRRRARGGGCALLSAVPKRVPVRSERGLIGGEALSAGRELGLLPVLVEVGLVGGRMARDEARDPLHERRVVAEPAARDGVDAPLRDADRLALRGGEAHDLAEAVTGVHERAPARGAGRAGVAVVVDVDADEVDVLAAGVDLRERQVAVHRAHAPVELEVGAGNAAHRLHGDIPEAVPQRPLGGRGAERVGEPCAVRLRGETDDRVPQPGAHEVLGERRRVLRVGAGGAGVEPVLADELARDEILGDDEPARGAG